MNEFDWLKLSQALVELVNFLLIALDNLRGSPMATYKRDNSVCKIDHISVDLLVCDDQKKFKKVAKVFEEWLGTYGRVCRPTTAQAEATTAAYPLPVRPDVVQHVRDIGARRGPAGGIFTKQQEYGLGVSSTFSWEERVRERAGLGERNVKREVGGTK